MMNFFIGFLGFWVSARYACHIGTWVIVMVIVMPMTKTKTIKKDKDTQTQTKTNTKWFQDPMHAIFFEKQDIKYGIYSKNSHPSFPPSISIKTRHQECAVAALGADHGPCPW